MFEIGDAMKQPDELGAKFVVRKEKFVAAAVEEMTVVEAGLGLVNYIDGKVSYGLSIKNVGTEYNSDFSEDAEIKEKMQEESRMLYVALTRTIRKLVWFKDLDSDVEDCWANYMEVSE